VFTVTIPTEYSVGILQRVLKFCFLTHFAICETVGVPSVVFFLFPTESVTEQGITDDHYSDGQIPSVRQSVKMLPMNCVPYTDGINPSVKQFNGVVFND